MRYFYLHLSINEGARPQAGRPSASFPENASRLKPQTTRRPLFKPNHYAKQTLI